VSGVRISFTAQYTQEAGTEEGNGEIKKAYQRLVLRRLQRPHQPEEMRREACVIRQRQEVIRRE